MFLRRDRDDALHDNLLDDRLDDVVEWDKEVVLSTENQPTPSMNSFLATNEAFDVLRVLRSRLAPEVYTACDAIFDRVRAHRGDVRIRDECMASLLSISRNDEIAHRRLSAYLARHEPSSSIAQPP